MDTTERAIAEHQEQNSSGIFNPGLAALFGMSMTAIYSAPIEKVQADPISSQLITKDFDYSLFPESSSYSTVSFISSSENNLGESLLQLRHKIEENSKDLDEESMNLLYDNLSKLYA